MRRLFILLNSAAALAVFAAPAVAGPAVPGPGGAPVPPSLGALIATGQCVQGGPTAADAAVADRVRPKMNGPRLGQQVSAYNVSCARTIVNTVRGRGLNQRAAVIATTTAITESTLHNYTEAVDHDSLGLFQQRPSQGWGTPAQITDPVYATNAFLNAMLRIYPNNSWMSGSIGAICQAVQRSAVPDAYGREEHDAQLLVSRLWSSGSDTVAWVTRQGGLQIHASDGPYAGGVLIHATPNADEVLVAGDWNGDGTDTVAWVTRVGGLQIHGADGPYAGGRLINANPPSDAYLLPGDWDGDGDDTVAWVTRQGGLQIHASDGPYAGGVLIHATPNADEVLVAGDWNGDGTDTVAWVTRVGGLQIHGADGPYAGGRLINANPPSDAYLVPGDWDGDGDDTVAWVTRQGGLQIHASDGPYAGGRLIDPNPASDAYLIAGDWDGS